MNPDGWAHSQKLWPFIRLQEGAEFNRVIYRQPKNIPNTDQSRWSVPSERYIQNHVINFIGYPNLQIPRLSSPSSFEKWSVLVLNGLGTLLERRVTAWSHLASFETLWWLTSLYQQRIPVQPWQWSTRNVPQEKKDFMTTCCDVTDKYATHF